MRILGADLRRGARRGDHAAPDGALCTLVALDADGRQLAVERPGSLPELATTVVRLAAGEPFMLGVDTPVAVPDRAARSRPVENLVRKRFGVRLDPGGRAAPGVEARGILGETLLAALGAAGTPCLPYPDRDGRSPCLVEIHPEIVARCLLWAASPLAADERAASRAALFRALAVDEYRAARVGARVGWAERAMRIDQLLARIEGAPGFELDAVRTALAEARDDEGVERAASLLDATLVAGTAGRHVAEPASTLFFGDRATGYVVTPADGSVRRLALGEPGRPSGQLFPERSLRERLGGHARLRALDLVDMPGRAPRVEALFDPSPRYEFDNLDEMLWWKHCRHVGGPSLPTRGLRRLTVQLGGSADADDAPLTLARSRHQSLSFRFEPPDAWRTHLATRDRRTYGFRVVRAIYETMPEGG